MAKAGPTRGGNGNLKRVLGIAAMAAVRKKDSYYGVYYRRLAARRGRQPVLVAVMRKLAIAIWHILHHRVEHHDLGADHFTNRDPQQAIKRMTHEANALGMTVPLRSHPSRIADGGSPSQRHSRCCFVSEPAASFTAGGLSSRSMRQPLPADSSWRPCRVPARPGE